MKPTTLMNIFRQFNLDEYSYGMNSGLWESALEDTTEHYVAIQEGFSCLHILDVETLKDTAAGCCQADIFTLPL